MLEDAANGLANAFPPQRREVPDPATAPEQVTGFFTDTTLCIGCKACEVACKQWNQLPSDGLRFTGHSYDNTSALGARTWRHVTFKEKDGADKLRWLMVSDVCKHCVDAPCQQVCPTGAIIYNAKGNVYVQQDICNGCGYCVAACPFGVLDRDEEDGLAHKCTLCYDRQEGGMEPACAKACPTSSIKFGPLDELRATAQARVEELHGKGHASAYLYGADSLGDYGPLQSFFLLDAPPAEYNLPDAPKQPLEGQGARYAAGMLAGAVLTGLAALAFAKGEDHAARA